MHKETIDVYFFQHQNLNPGAYEAWARDTVPKLLSELDMDRIRIADLEAEVVRHKRAYRDLQDGIQACLV